MQRFPQGLWRAFRAQPRTRRILQGALLGLAMAAAVTFWLWRAEPRYWRETREFQRSHSPEQLRALADSVHLELGRLTAIDAENSGVRHNAAPQGDDPDEASDPPQEDPPGTAQTPPPRRAGFYMTQPSDPRKITLDRDRLRAWVMTHLDAALRGAGQELPRAIANPVIDVNDGRFVLGFEYNSPEIRQVVSVYFRLGFEDDGRARVLLDGASAGRLPIPIRSVAKHMRKNDSHPAAEAVATMIDQLDSYRFDPVMPYDGQRNVRLLDARLEGESAEFTVRFEPKSEDGP